ncbi:MAG: hypothetical protein M1133_09755 [Armatimonadetes bacterium]|nr:hypothetical protein [Armatimonadota bacterium]
MEEHERERDVEGQKGGTAEAYMGAGAVPVAGEVVIPIGRIQWGPVLSGLAVAMGLTILLSALGRGLGLMLGPTGVGPLAYWLVGSAAVGLFLGGMLAARQSRASHIWTGAMHGLVIWSLFIIADTVFGMVGYFSHMTSMNVFGPMRTVISTTGAWWLFIGYIVLLIASSLGGVAGITSEEHPSEPRRP